MPSKGLVFISKTSFSGSSAVNVDNVFSATYVHYLVRRNLSSSSASDVLNVRLRVSGTDSSTGYRYQQLQAGSTTVTAARSTTATSFEVGLGNAETTSAGFVEFWVSNPFPAVRTTGWVDAGQVITGNITITSLAFAHDSTTSYTGFSVLPTLGTITGSISVFGLVTA